MVTIDKAMDDLRAHVNSACAEIDTLRAEVARLTRERDSYAIDSLDVAGIPAFIAENPDADASPRTVAALCEEISRLTRERDEARASRQPGPVVLSEEEISDEFVDRVEHRIEHGCGACDMVNPKAIIAAVLAEAAKGDHVPDAGKMVEPEPAPPAVPGDEELGRICYETGMNFFHGSAVPWNILVENTKRGWAEVARAVRAADAAEIERLRARVRELEGAIHRHFNGPPDKGQRDHALWAASKLFPAWHRS